MTAEEKQKAIDALKISAPVISVTHEEFNDYIQTLNKIMDWLEQEPKTGHWIRWYEQKQDDNSIEHIPHCKCSECGKEYIPDLSPYINFCSNCGIKYLRETESEDKNENINSVG